MKTAELFRIVPEHVHYNTLDLRPIPREKRMLRVNQVCAVLSRGSAFIVVTDTEPHDLIRQFEFKQEGGFGCEVLEQGIDFWRVMITRGR